MIEEAHQAPAQPSTDDQSHKRYELLSDSKAAAAYISAAITTVAVASETPSVTSRGIAEVITYTANSVASVPAPQAQTTAAAIVAAITDHIANLVAGPGNELATVRRLGVAVRGRDIPNFTTDFCTVIGKITFLVGSAKQLPLDHVAVTIASAVAAVANAIGNSSAGTR